MSVKLVKDWDETVKDTIENSEKFYFLKSFYEHLKLIEQTKGTEYAYHIFELMCRYAFFGENPELPDNEKVFFNGIISDHIDIGKKMIEKEKKKALKMPLYIEGGYVYIIEVNGYYKIGRTENPDNRLGEYTKLMEIPKTICCEYVAYYKNVEKELHEIFKARNTNGEWFNLSNDEVALALDYINARKINPPIK